MKLDSKTKCIIVTEDEQRLLWALPDKFPRAPNLGRAVADAAFREASNRLLGINNSQHPIFSDSAASVVYEDTVSALLAASTKTKRSVRR